MRSHQSMADVLCINIPCLQKRSRFYVSSSGKGKTSFILEHIMNLDEEIIIIRSVLMCTVDKEAEDKYDNKLLT